MYMNESCLLFFFFKQKTAYEMRISDWSSDVCSSDLGISRTVELNGFRFDIGGHRFFSKSQEVVDLWNEILPHDFIQRPQIGRASCREECVSTCRSRWSPYH